MACLPRQVPARRAVLRTWCVNSVLMRRSPDIERYTISSNGRLGRLLLDAELCPDSASKAEKDQVRNTVLRRLMPDTLGGTDMYETGYGVAYRVDYPQTPRKPGSIAECFRTGASRPQY